MIDNSKRGSNKLNEVLNFESIQTNNRIKALKGDKGSNNSSSG